jgi:hypothetical protein
MRLLFPSFLLIICSPIFSQPLTIDSAVAKIPIGQFPLLARYSNLHGNVKVLVTLRDGRVEKVSIDETHKMFANFVTNFIKQTEFKSTASGILNIEFQFFLTKEPDFKGPWQKFIVDPESNCIRFEATQKVSIDTDKFQ